MSKGALELEMETAVIQKPCAPDAAARGCFLLKTVNRCTFAALTQIITVNDKILDY